MAYNVIGKILPGSRITTIFAIGFGGIVYVLALILVRCLKKEDILNLPKDKEIASVMEKYKLI